VFTEDCVTKLGVVGLPDTVIVDDDETGDSLIQAGTYDIKSINFRLTLSIFFHNVSDS